MAKLSNIAFQVVHGDKVSTVVAYQPDSETPLHQADSTHPHWQTILDKLHANDESVFDLFDVAGAAAKKLMVLSERITYDHGLIRLDGEPQDGPLAEHLVRVVKTGTDDYEPVVKFWELVEQNPSERSREQMFAWLAKHDFSIDEDGYIIGYKSVNTVHAGDTNSNKPFKSTHAGHGFVNGVEYNNAYLPQGVGDVVSIPRKEVDDNKNRDCSTGLHVGDWSYAQSFTGSVKLKVRVNPRDVVSIPKDDVRKMRCCRYEVLAVVTQPDDAPIVFSVKDSAKKAEPVGYKPFG
jgi:hypothetical protein